jgi:hypothetical protein
VDLSQPTLTLVVNEAAQPEAIHLTSGLFWISLFDPGLCGWINGCLAATGQTTHRGRLRSAPLVTDRSEPLDIIASSIANEVSMSPEAERVHGSTAS